MTRWEYRAIYRYEFTDLASLLNQLGMDGWELVSVQDVMIFKRPCQVQISYPNPNTQHNPERKDQP